MEMLRKIVAQNVCVEIKYLKSLRRMRCGICLRRNGKETEKNWKEFVVTLRENETGRNYQ